MIRDKILHIKEELSNHKRSRDELLKYYINLRLKKSLTTYLKELKLSSDYLNNRVPINVIKKI